MTNETARTRRLAVTALLAALIVVMQVLSYVIPIRPFNLALVLIPIVVGACLLGPRTGALLGGAFSASRSRSPALPGWMPAAPYYGSKIRG